MELTDQERLFRRRRKWIWGCTGGCLSLMVVAAAVLIGIWMWLGKGQPVPPAEAFLTARTGTFVFVRIEPDDPMMVEVPVRLAMQPAVSNQVPTKDNRPLRVDAERMREVVTKVGPIQLVLVGTRSEGEPPLRWGVAASVGHFGRALDFVLQSTARKADMPAREIYKGGVILTADEDGVFGIRQNTYMAAEQESLLHAWLDGIEADRERAGRPEPGQTALPAGMDAQLLSAYERLDRDSPVRFGCLNTRGELGLLLDRLPNKDVAARLRDAGLAEPAVQCISGQLRSMNSRDAALTVRVSCADDRTAGAIAAALTQLIEDKERFPHLRDPIVEQQDDGTIQLTGRIENLPDRVAEMVNLIDEPE